MEPACLWLCELPRQLKGHRACLGLHLGCLLLLLLELLLPLHHTARSAGGLVQVNKQQ